MLLISKLLLNDPDPGSQLFCLRFSWLFANLALKKKMDVGLTLNLISV